jgi:hypothetical protein
VAVLVVEIEDLLVDFRLGDNSHYAFSVCRPANASRYGMNSARREAFLWLKTLHEDAAA